MGTFNKQAVIETASQLEKLFLHYQAISEDAKAAYKQCKSLIERAKSGEITSATDEKLPGGYFSTEFDLINFDDLYHAASLLDVYLEGWESEDAFNKHMESMLRK